MSSARGVIRWCFRGERVPWEWNEPWSWITAGLVVIVVAMLVARIWVEIPATWLWAANGFMAAAAFHRFARYLQRTGKRPDKQGKFQDASILWLVLALMLLVLSLIGAFSI